MPSNCRTCGAKITWARTEAGKNTPLDFPGEKRVVIDEDGVARVFDTFVSHFSTCPDAAEHRKKKGEK
jgi:hypothetical protein